MAIMVETNHSFRPFYWFEKITCCRILYQNSTKNIWRSYQKHIIFRKIKNNTLFFKTIYSFYCFQNVGNQPVSCLVDDLWSSVLDRATLYVTSHLTVPSILLYVVIVVVYYACLYLSCAFYRLSRVQIKRVLLRLRLIALPALVLSHRLWAQKYKE